MKFSDCWYLFRWFIGILIASFYLYYFIDPFLIAYSKLQKEELAVFSCALGIFLIACIARKEVLFQSFPHISKKAIGRIFFLAVNSLAATISGIATFYNISAYFRIRIFSGNILKIAEILNFFAHHAAYIFLAIFYIGFVLLFSEKMSGWIISLSKKDQLDNDLKRPALLMVLLVLAITALLAIGIYNLEPKEIFIAGNLIIGITFFIHIESLFGKNSVIFVRKHQQKKQ